MVDRAKKVPELPSTSVLSDEDLFVVERVDGSSSVTSKMLASDLRKSLVPGPYTSDQDAEDAGVGLGGIYHTQDGTVRVRVT